ncbi:MAG: hypothetical protein LUC33_05270 [Prevotellaceae bacterium]|nr:hypothetical protein [Prevotellaceae bacterium]
MSKARRLNLRLNLLSWAVVSASVVLLILGELNWLPNGILPPSYALQITECLLMLLCVPLALRLTTLKSLRRHYPTLATLRIIMLAMPLLLGLALYFLMMDTSMLYCSLIAALAFLYIWPTRRRMLYELHG